MVPVLLNKLLCITDLKLLLLILEFVNSYVYLNTCIMFIFAMCSDLILCLGFQNFFFEIYTLIYIIHRRQAMAARAEAERDGIQVPLTLEDYCIKTQVKPNTSDSQVEMTDFYDDDYDEDYDDPSDDSDYAGEDDNDSGNGES